MMLFNFLLIILNNKVKLLAWRPIGKIPLWFGTFMKLSYQVEKKRQIHDYCRNYACEYEEDYHDSRKLFFIDCDYNRDCDCDNEKRNLYK